MLAGRIKEKSVKRNVLSSFLTDNFNKSSNSVNQPFDLYGPMFDTVGTAGRVFSGSVGLLAFSPFEPRRLFATLS